MAASAKANELEQRLVLFATGIVKLSRQLRRDPESRHIANQVLRSGTAAAANYAEARSAESRADFIHKLKVALKELNETSIWLRIVEGNVAENRERCKIILASIQTARRNMEEVH